MNTHNTGHKQPEQQPDRHSEFIAQTEKLVGLFNPQTADQLLERIRIEGEIEQMFQWLSALDPVKDKLVLGALAGLEPASFWNLNWDRIPEWIQSCLHLSAVFALVKASESATGENHCTIMAMQHWGGTWESLSPESIKDLPAFAPSAFEWIDDVKSSASFAHIKDVYPDCPFA